VSNFDFGGSPAQDYRPPAPHQLPQQPVQQLTPSSGGPVPPDQVPPGQVPPGQAPPGQAPPGQAEKVGGGITPVGLISVLVLVLFMLGAAFLGNRVWPINSRIDSAWWPAEGSAQELTNGLRQAGYSCSDEGMLIDRHLHRLCAKYDDASSVAVEFAGTSQGEIQRVHISSAGRVTPQDQQDVGLALDLSIPDPNHEAAAKAKLARGASDRQQVSGPWGTAGYDDDGAFVVDRGWAGAPPHQMSVPGGVEAVRQAAGAAAYACGATTPMVCQRTADAATWTLTVSGTSPNTLDLVQLEGSITNPEELDTAAELAAVLPAGPSRDRVIWFVRTGDHTHGHAGFAGGVVVDHQVTRSGDRPTNVSVTIRSR
jgi:hypothetical protein